MNKPPTLTSCCQVTAYADPVCVVGGNPVKIRIGSVARCAKCHKIKSDFRADKSFGDKQLSEMQRKLNGTSWAMFVDKLVRQPDAAPNFEIGPTGVLVPENYKGELKQQAEFDEEAPF